MRVLGQSQLDSRKNMRLNRLQKTKYLAAFLVALLTFLVYVPAFQNGFVSWDDHVYVYDNMHIRSLDLAFFHWAFFGFCAGNWHPLTAISLALDYAVWGLKPFGYHLNSVVLHCLNTFLVMMLIWRLIEAAKPTPGNDGGAINHPLSPTPAATRNGGASTLIAATMTGLLFGLHPIHVESVAWVSERKDVLCAFFSLLSLLSYVGYCGSIGRDGGKRVLKRFSPGAGYFFSIFFFGLAIMSKPMAVSLPLVLVVLDWHPFGRFLTTRIKNVLLEKAPFFFISIVSSVIAIQAQHSSQSVVPLIVSPPAERIIVSFYALSSYILKLLVPVNLVPFYAYPRDIAFFSPKFFVPVVFVVCVTMLCLAAIRSQKIWAAVWGYFIVTLLPVIGIVQVGDQAMADRYTYLPSIGPFMLAGIGSAMLIQYLARRIRNKAVTIVASSMCLLLPLVALSELSFRQIKIWRDSETLWRRVTDAEPTSTKGLLNLGMALYRKGRISEVITLYERVLSIEPWEIDALNNLAICFIDTKQYDKALPYALRAAAAGPGDGTAFNTLGEIYFAKKRYKDALSYFMQSFSIDPASPTRCYNVALAFEKLEKTAESCKYWTEYFHLGQDLPDANKISLHMAELKCQEHEKGRPALSR